MEMNIEQIFKNNRKWVSDKLSIDSRYFENLAKGQDPEILYIGCSDSRATSEELMGVAPGEAFIHRNIANMVPNNDLSVQSVIAYAIGVLKVNHIIVCGHYDCGGVKAAMEPKDYGILNPWLRNIRDVYRLHNRELTCIQDENIRYNRLVELNVQEQCINVIKTSDYQRAYSARKVTVHGWVWDIRTGKLIDLEIDFDKILKNIMEIYRLK
ncbi:MAG: carbonic anhydrase [Salinivirgaceae bacterium]|nr:carbonic anhydrase [Salinivirgaceae bacterium]